MEWTLLQADAALLPVPCLPVGERMSGAKYAKVSRMLLNIDPIMVLGLVAGAFTTVAFVPQVIRTWRVKSASDLSIAMISLNSTGIFLWLIYGLYTRSFPIIIANLVTFVLIFTVLILAIKYR